MKIVITGATGFIGSNLARAFQDPILLGRNPEKMIRRHPHGRAVKWDGKDARGLPPEIWDGVDAVVHLAGESVFKGRWDDEKKKRIRDSRIDGTRALVDAMGRGAKRPRIFLCASAIGYYGDRGEELLDESSAPGEGFLAEVSKAWEKEAARATALEIRTVSIRIGLVLGKDGGALPQLLTPFKLGLGGRLGSGHQYMSWVHIQDLVGIMLHALASDSLSGPVNGVSPNPITNREFTKVLAGVLHRPAFLPVPPLALKLALGEFGKELLASQRVLPKKATSSGYEHAFGDLAAAFRDLLGS